MYSQSTNPATHFLGKAHLPLYTYMSLSLTRDFAKLAFDIHFNLLSLTYFCLFLVKEDGGGPFTASGTSGATLSINHIKT